MLFTLTKNLR